MVFWVRLEFLPTIRLTDGQKVQVTGVLTEEPQILGNKQKLNLALFEIWTERYPAYHYGDFLKIVGRVKRKPLVTIRFPFISASYYLAPFTTYQLYEPEIKTSIDVTSTTRTVERWAIWLRLRLLDIYNRTFPRPLDGIVSGIVLGDKSMISNDFWHNLQQTGTLHIMVASGMNISMFSSGVLSFFLLFFKRRLAICCLLIVIWFYSIMTGLTPPMIRAATLTSLIHLSNIVGREADTGRMLLVAAFLIIFINPLLILDTGFQLSLLATVGLVYVQPRLKKLGSSDVLQNDFKNFSFIRRRLLRLMQLMMQLMQFDNFSSSLAASITTLPILLINFGQLNLLSPFINLIILWTIPFVLQLGMAVGILGLLWIKLADLASYLVYPWLFFLEQSVSLFAKIKFLQIEFSRINWWWGMAYYFVLWRWIKKRK